jgi:hypothetical protein
VRSRYSTVDVVRSVRESPIEISRDSRTRLNIAVIHDLGNARAIPTSTAVM